MRVFAAAARSDLAGSRELPPAREVLGSDHPLSRATEACRVLRLQLIGTAAWTASMTAWGVAAPPVSITVLAAGVTVVGLLSAALLFARTMRAERARDLIADGCVPSLSSEVAAESARLAGGRCRQSLARRLARAQHAADHWEELLVTSRPPNGVRSLAGHAALTGEVITALDRPQPNVRGVALLDRLLRGGYAADLYTLPADRVEPHLAGIRDVLRAPRSGR